MATVSGCGEVCAKEEEDAEEEEDEDEAELVTRWVWDPRGRERVEEAEMAGRTSPELPGGGFCGSGRFCCWLGRPGEPGEAGMVEVEVEVGAAATAGLAGEGDGVGRGVNARSPASVYE